MSTKVVDFTFEMHNPNTLYVLTADKKVSKVNDKCEVSATVQLGYEAEKVKIVGALLVA